MTSILPMAYFGNLEYFWYLTKASKVSIDLDEVYLKQTYRNRTEILGANGTLPLSIPVIRPHGSKSKSVQVLIDHQQSWKKIHLKSIESAYRRTPYYEFYEDQMTAIFDKNHEFLWELNVELTHWLIDKLGIDCEIDIIHSNSPKIELTTDLRLNLSPKTKSHFMSPNYLQTFSERMPFIPNLSILDLMFNEGPNSICILEESTIKNE